MKYSFALYQMQVEDHIFWVAESKELNGCVAQGDTQEEALSQLAENEDAWLEGAQEAGIPIPPVFTVQEQIFSGKFTVRLSSKEHKNASKQAERLGISLNQYINDAIVAYNYENRTENRIELTMKAIMEKNTRTTMETLTRDYTRFSYRDEAPQQKESYNILLKPVDIASFIERKEGLM